MRFDLIKKMDGLEMYGNIPCLPENIGDFGERFVGEESDSWLLLDDFVKGIDEICDNDLDYGDVDYFDVEKCKKIRQWLSKRLQRPMSSRIKYLYEILNNYINEAIDRNTGVVIEL